MYIVCKSNLVLKPTDLPDAHLFIAVNIPLDDKSMRGSTVAPLHTTGTTAQSHTLLWVCTVRTVHTHSNVCDCAVVPVVCRGATVEPRMLLSSRGIFTAINKCASGKSVGFRTRLDLHTIYTSQISLSIFLESYAGIPTIYESQ